MATSLTKLEVLRAINKAALADDLASKDMMVAFFKSIMEREEENNTYLKEIEVDRESESIFSRYIA